MKRALVGIVLASVGLIGCAKYQPGDCIQSVRYGNVWRVTGYNWADGYWVQMWLDGKWVAPVKREPKFNFDSVEYVKIACPFSTEIMKPIR